jgi:outer membrane protein assembly factor BamB/serine/threonine protein kinase
MTEDPRRPVSRRRVLQVLGTATVAGTSGDVIETASAQRDDSWPMFRGDDSNTGHATETAGPTNDPDLAWSVETAVGVPSSPAVVEDTVYVGSGDANVYALSATDGNVEWTFETDEAVASSPLVADGTVYVGSRDGSVYALSAVDGSREWSFQTGSAVFASPTITGDTVVVPSRDGSIYALAATDGSEQWTFETGDEVWSSPAVADDTVFVGSRDRNVYALSATDGGERWSFQADDWIESSPAVSGGTLYVGSLSGSVYALNVADGTEKWRAQFPDVVASSPAVTDDAVYFGSRDGSVYALNVADGAERWAFRTGGRVFSSPAVADGVLYVGSASNAVYALDVADGAELWAYETDGGVFSSPAVADGTLYVGSNDASVYALSDPAPTGDGTGLALLAVIGVLGLGGAGVFWRYWRRREESGSGTGTSGPAKAESTETSERAQPDEAIGTTDVSEYEDAVATGAGLTTSEPMPNVAERNVPQEIPTGPRVDIDYETLTNETPIGSGGNADVTRADVGADGETVSVAIKRPRLSGTISADAIDQILTEAETWDTLDDHDHIVDVVDYGAQPLPWIAMEYMDGGDLGDRISEIGTEQAIWTALAVTNGVHHAHRQGIAHLDLKPENILFRSVEGAWDVPKVSDWGLAKELLNHSKSIEGFSPQYAAPEQFSDGHGQADDITDVYQLGTVFYELFTGRPPFEGTPARVMQGVLNEAPRPPSERADVPPALDEILLTALEKKKADRYDSLVYLRDALQKLYDDYLMD